MNSSEDERERRRNVQINYKEIVKCVSDVRPKKEKKPQTQQLEMKKNIWFHIRRYILGMDMGQPQPASYRTLLLDTIFSLFFPLLSLSLFLFFQIKFVRTILRWADIRPVSVNNSFGVHIFLFSIHKRGKPNTLQSLSCVLDRELCYFHRIKYNMRVCVVCAKHKASVVFSHIVHRERTGATSTASNNTYFGLFVTVCVCVCVSHFTSACAYTRYTRMCSATTRRQFVRRSHHHKWICAVVHNQQTKCEISQQRGSYM